MLNLILNARNALSHGGTISISTKNIQLTETDCVRPECRPGNHVMLTIADSGTGIPQDAIDTLHKSFMTAIGSESSVGLGLIMVARIVRKMNGWMNVQGTPGKGSVFEIILPAA
jgi:signal transduction histidine kinase